MDTTPADSSTDSIAAQARAAREASRQLASLSTDLKNAVLLDLANEIGLATAAILAANAADVAAARAANLDAAKLARLTLSESSLLQLRDGLKQVAALPDPVGAVVAERTVPSGLHIRRVRAPLGVICMIYEARPAVTIDAFALCFKAGNACLLKGGKEAARSNALLAEIARSVLSRRGVPAAALCGLTGLDREALRELLRLDHSIDLVIPRGGTELIRFVAEHSRIPTIQHYHGVCHIYVDSAADLSQALRICVTAKTSAPATCNAAECILVSRGVAAEFLPALARAYADAGVEVRADPAALAHCSGAIAASPEDFGREFLALTVAIAVVDDLDAAIAHIHRHGSGHTDAIVTADPAAAEIFCRRVQSSCVLVNASTRFNDGYQLGLGAEIGISTTRLHAYGPMGLEELTIPRFVVTGTGQTR